MIITDLVSTKPCSRGSQLVADIGGTHVRFGLAVDGRLEAVRTLLCADFDSISQAARTYLAEATPGQPPCEAAFAAAGPLRDGRIQMTNHVWNIDIEEVRRELLLDRFEVLNDFAALALALPVLGADGSTELKPGIAEPGWPLAVMGPGTGLGVAAIVPEGNRWIPVATEGGHRELSPKTEREWQIIQRLQQSFDHVSAERALSGPGLVNLYQAICGLLHIDPEPLTPAAVVQGARSCPACAEAVLVFTSWLGSVAGDLALTVGARGGVFLGGGVVPKMGDAFDVALFNERFLAKGRFHDYLEPIPVRLVTNPHAALLGAAQVLAKDTWLEPSAVRP